MKKNLLLLIFLASAIVLVLASCGNGATYHTVKFDTGSASSIQARAVIHGGTVAKPQDPYLRDYSFIGWFAGDTPWDFESNTVTSDITLTARFERIVYKVTFDTDGSLSELQINSGDTVTRPENPKKNLYDFAGWFYGDALWNFDFDTVSSDITLTAKWTPTPTFSVIFNTDGGTPVTSQLIYRDFKVSVPSKTTKQGFDFAGWFYGDEPWNFDVNTVTADIILTARWTTAPTYTVTFDTNGGTYVEPQYIVRDSTAFPPAYTTKNNYKFDGWYIGNTEFDFSTPITADITVTAKWIYAPTYTVTFDTVDFNLLTSLSYSVENQYATPNEKVTEPISPDIAPQINGYKFLGWYNNDVKWDFANDTVTSDITLTARVVKVHKVTVNLGESSSGESLGILDVYYIEHGETFTAPLSPKYPVAEERKDWQFIGWYIDDDPYDFDAPVTEDIIISAAWMPMFPMFPF